jgi:hypothetical protein
MSTIKTKPRVLWGTTNPSALEWRSEKIYGSKRICDALYGRNHTIRVAIIPLNDVEAIVERAHKALQGANLLTDSESAIRAALTASGIPCLKRKASK